MKDMQLVAVKKVGAMGRVVIPADLRHLLGLEPGEPIGIYKSGNVLVLMPAPPLRRAERRTYRRPSDD
jgi:AbrB family looped-hinge helix DNA binding protein